MCLIVLYVMHCEIYLIRRNQYRKLINLSYQFKCINKDFKFIVFIILSKNNSNKPTQSEGESNLSERRLEWANKTTSNTTKDLLARDAAAFLHQSVSSPCLSTITKAEGPHIWDGEGRKYLDFHGNNGVLRVDVSAPRSPRSLLINGSRILVSWQY